MTRKLSGALAGAFLLLCGCSGTPPSHFFLLGPAGPEAAPAASPNDQKAGGPLLFVDPVTVAAYADRSQMVTRSLDGQVRFAEFQVWAEPVGNLITATLVDDLGRRLGPDRVLATPSRLDFGAEYRLTVDVLRFDVDEAGQAVLDARWTLLQGQGGRLVATRREHLAEQVADPASFPQRVAALDRTIETLADHIGQTIIAGKPIGK